MKWPFAKFEDVALPIKGAIVSGPFGSNIGSRFFVDEGVPVIRGNNLTFGDRRFIDDGFVFLTEDKASEFKNCQAIAGDLVFTAAGTIGQVAIIPENTRFNRYVISNKQLRVRCDLDKVSPLFLFMWFTTEHMRQHMINQNRGCSIPLINLGTLRKLPVPLPPLNVQEQIAATISAYDDLIENNRRRMALLEESARLLYREWFVRLRFPGHERTKIVDGVPKGWTKTSLSRYIERGAIDLQTGPFGTQLKASDYTEDGTPVINVRNIGYGELRPDKLEFVPDEIAERLSVHILRTNDIVFGRKGAVDRHLFISAAQDGWMQGSDCIRLRALSAEVCPLLLSFAFREESHREWMLIQSGNKATMASLNQEVISRIPFLQPTETLLREFQSFASDVLLQIANLSRQNEKLRAARDLLLPRLMSGEISL